MTQTIARLGSTHTAPQLAQRGWSGYAQRSQLPLTSLVFLIPLLIAYEVGTHFYAFNPIDHTEQRIIAFTLLQQFFELVGATGRYLPALAVVGILLSWHIARNDRWRVSLSTIGLMGVESFVLAMPIMLLSVAASHYVPLSSVASANWRTLTVLSIGAGIYEELVFRLIAFTLLSLILMDWLKLPRLASIILIVLIPAILFSLYHYLGNETPNLRSFIFRMLAGVYFGIIFLLRGFGITAGSHAAYDIIIVTMAVVR